MMQKLIAVYLMLVIFMAVVIVLAMQVPVIPAPVLKQYLKTQFGKFVGGIIEGTGIFLAWIVIAFIFNRMGWWMPS